jgi:pyruvate/2-oxoglutarate dehydrogenase complex dihydrolipoamide acyltransferase (E2) component
VDFQLPRLADSLIESTISRWLKKAGDKVSKGEALVEIETDKVNAELESPIDGVLAEIVVPEGQTAAVGAVIARLTEAKGS